MTGLAQVSGARGETRTHADMRRRIRYDLHYIANWSLWMDIKILAITPLLVSSIINRDILLQTGFEKGTPLQSGVLESARPNRPYDLSAVHMV